MDNLQGLLDKALERKDRPRSGKFSPSMLGRCYRAQIWNRQNIPQSNPPDERAQRVFKAGSLFHEFIQGVISKVYPSAQIELLIENEDFKGFADIVLDDEVIDLKSQHSRAFWHRRNLDWKKLEPKLMANILQVVYYAKEIGKPKARLVFISKDDLTLQEYPLIVGNYTLKLNEEIATLRDFWQWNALPPATPRAYPNDDGKFAECGYCSWKDKCIETEKQKGVTNEATKEDDNGV